MPVVPHIHSQSISPRKCNVLTRCPPGTAIPSYSSLAFVILVVVSCGLFVVMMMTSWLIEPEGAVPHRPACCCASLACWGSARQLPQIPARLVGLPERVDNSCLHCNTRPTGMLHCRPAGGGQPACSLLPADPD
jgi:hypothetical protein